MQLVSFHPLITWRWKIESFVALVWNQTGFCMHQPPKRLLPNCQTKTAGQSTQCSCSRNLRRAKKGKGWALKHGHSQEVAGIGFPDAKLVSDMPKSTIFYFCGRRDMNDRSIHKNEFYGLDLLLTHFGFFFIFTDPVPDAGGGLAAIKNPGPTECTTVGICQKEMLPSSLPCLDASSAAAQKLIPQSLGKHLSGDTTQLIKVHMGLQTLAWSELLVSEGTCTWIYSYILFSTFKSAFSSIQRNSSVNGSFKGLRQKIWQSIAQWSNTSHTTTTHTGLSWKPHQPK